MRTAGSRARPGAQLCLAQKLRNLDQATTLHVSRSYIGPAVEPIPSRFLCRIGHVHQEQDALASVQRQASLSGERLAGAGWHFAGGTCVAAQAAGTGNGWMR